MKFDELMMTMAEQETCGPAVRVSMDRIAEQVDDYRPVIWRNCAVVTSLIAALLFLTFSIGWQMDADYSRNSVDEVVYEYENLFAYSY